FEDQVKELNAIYESGTDALILITNRLDINNEGDDVFIANAEKLLERLPKEVKLGFYECPYPYKRLVTPKILEWCKSTGRFYYMKDTCCDSKVIAERVELLKGSKFRLLNANCQTLLETMRAGAHGYCGIMCNYHPKLYAWLGENINNEKADLVQSVIGTFGYTESGVPYPLSAKYHMNLVGIPTEEITRNPACKPLSDYYRDSMKQMKYATDALEKIL
ncbi:MAG: dihydrodipicolinate synthase family protein, partial [Clostridia bacterium]|nr:dihydrodipicolinate synthase family protein [Clostridia bacterium]